MSDQDIIQGLQNYQHASKKKQGQYLKIFEKMMIYRTTKTENPEVTPKMVEKSLNKLNSK